MSSESDTAYIIQAVRRLESAFLGDLDNSSRGILHRVSALETAQAKAEDSHRWLFRTVMGGFILIIISQIGQIFFGG